ncbi:phage tail fiber protein [Prescottella agglutinans]|uniref:Uncharacterized protein n=1 Tax=Prescottella agglutinans TaxID=1644129 RepID=A0ABT6M4U3_9NOCA|nr:hypothetical protein [Prescottella agglutinans]MDH6279328.1 hypothetical protein [Prescottella agglutinans]
MPIMQAATRQILANAYAAAGTWISVHTGTPTNGANEATGGSPAYARKQTTWGAGANGTKTGSQVAIDVPAGTYTYVGIWDAANGGNLVDYVAMTSTTLGAQGQILVTPTFTQS